MKLSAIVDRPTGPQADAGWASTGDRYLLRLFRHFVFHQVRGGLEWEGGKPFQVVSAFSFRICAFLKLICDKKISRQVDEEGSPRLDWAHILEARAFLVFIRPLFFPCRF